MAKKTSHSKDSMKKIVKVEKNEKLPLFAAGLAGLLLLFFIWGAGHAVFTAKPTTRSVDDAVWGGGESVFYSQKMKKSQGVVLAYPLPGTEVNAPFTVKGVADSDERFLSVRLIDSSGEKIDEHIVEPERYAQVPRSSVFAFEAPLSLFNSVYPKDAEKMTIEVYEIFPGANTLSEKKLLSVPVTVKFEIEPL